MILWLEVKEGLCATSEQDVMPGERQVEECTHGGVVHCPSRATRRNSEVRSNARQGPRPLGIEVESNDMPGQRPWNSEVRTNAWLVEDPWMVKYVHNGRQKQSPLDSAE